MKTWQLATAAIAVVASVSAVHAQNAAPVPYPEGYRGWTHVKSMVIDRGHPLFEAFGGIHHIYGNPRAMEGYRSGRFADGSVIVFDLLDATRTTDNAVVEGGRKVVGVMRKNAKTYAATGGWGFEGFKGDSKTERAVGAKAAEACFACHDGQKAKGYVFSAYRK